MTQFTGSVTVSIDDDGFLRRECPNCEREFKWLHGEQGEAMPESGYHCPYCDGRSEDGWWTRPQLAHIQAKVAAHAEELVHNELRDLEKSSSAFMKVTVSRSRGSAIPPVPEEPNDRGWRTSSGKQMVLGGAVSLLSPSELDGGVSRVAALVSVPQARSSREKVQKFL